MVAITKDVIQKFYKGLLASRHKSAFDFEFLTNHTLLGSSQDLLSSPDFSVCNYDSEQWIAFFNKRLRTLFKTEFDWTKIGLGLDNAWLKAKSHANYHWYHLALKIVEQTGKHLTEVIFPGIEIAAKDRPNVTNAKHFASLIYTNDFKRLLILNRMFLVAEENVCCFANYDENGNEPPVSLNELLQIRNKLTLTNQYYKPIVISNWADFKVRYYSLWGVQKAPDNFDEFIYPLYRLVVNYFSELSRDQPEGSTHELLDNLHQELLEILDEAEPEKKSEIDLDNTQKMSKASKLNFFYGQCIERTELRLNSIYLQDILLDLKETHDLNLLLSDMAKLAVWITSQNPAMLITHARVNELYRTEKMGPYFSQQQLADELTKILRYRRELAEHDLELVDNLKNDLLSYEQFNAISTSQLVIPMAEDVLFTRLMEIFESRAEYNRTETFLVLNKDDFRNDGSYQYVHHRVGVNVAYIRLARLLQACGFWRRHGIEDYFQVLMPELASPIDAVTRRYLSERPFSHYALPEIDRSYLICLDNSLEYQLQQQKFYNINAENAGPFTPTEFDSIKRYAAHKFRKYPRIPQYTHYPLRTSTLSALVNLVNDSLIFDATKNADGYSLQEGFSILIQDRVIEYEIEQNRISYQIRDSWNIACIHRGSIIFKSDAEYRFFNTGTDAQRLMFILNEALRRGHARSNVTIIQYCKAYAAYVHFRKLYRNLPNDERERLKMVSMRFGANVRTFEEVFQDGYPDCMSSASRWFANLVLDYVPMIRFRHDLEDEKYKEIWAKARRDSQHLYMHYIVSDYPTVTSLRKLVHLLTHASSRYTAGWAKLLSENAILQDRVLPIVDVAEHEHEHEEEVIEPLTEESILSLLCIEDKVVTTGLSYYSLFAGHKRSYTSSYAKGIHSGTTSESGSFDGDLDSKLSYGLVDTSDEFSADTTECSSVSSASTKSSRSPSPRSLFLMRENYARRMLELSASDTDNESDFNPLSRADSFY